MVMRSRLGVVLGLCCAASGAPAAYGQNMILNIPDAYMGPAPLVDGSGGVVRAIIPEGVIVRDPSAPGGFYVQRGQEAAESVVASPEKEPRIGALPTGLERPCSGQDLTQRISCLDPSGGAAQNDVSAQMRLMEAVVRGLMMGASMHLPPLNPSER